MKLLLINPKFSESFWSFKWAMDKFMPAKRALNPPLGLATLAALTPEHWDIEIVDENVKTIPLEPDADIIGVCGMGVQFSRQQELLTFYRHKGYFVVAGGSYASLCPEAYESVADTIISGEAEYIWPEFCRDIESGQARPLYRETGNIALADSPVPRFDLLDLDKYRTVSLQYSRGCPYNCEFCDIIVMFGRKPRVKPLENVERELDSLRSLGIHSLFFVDDNLIGNKTEAKKLLRFLAEYQTRHNFKFQFGTEVSLNLAGDDELLGLLRQANFEWVFIGIESPDEDSLKETGKTQNMNQDILASVWRIYSFGIDVLGGFIIGFDNDTIETFEKQYRFIMDSGIQSAMIGLLSAIPKTPLYNRLESENRLNNDVQISDNPKLATNVVPKRMSTLQLVNGYEKLHRRLFSDHGIGRRVRNKMRHIARPVYGMEFSRPEKVRMIRRFMLEALKPGGPKRLLHFVKSILFIKPRLIPLAISDWILGLSMQNYINRHFVQEYNEDTRRARRYVARMKEALRHRSHEGALGVSIREMENKASAVWISMKGRLEPGSFNSIPQHVERLLRNTRSSVILQIDGFNRSQLVDMTQLLQRLSRFGDRIQIRLDEASRRIINIDSSIFMLALQPD